MKTRPPMKLSDKTISVLKNFSSINQSILFKEGNKLRTISAVSYTHLTLPTILRV